MSKHAARVQRLSHALEAGLADLESTLAIAVWCEADADAGYLVHRDGRMMPLGEYQYGFSSVEEMKAAALADEDTEVAKWARAEIGQVASNMTPYDSASDDEDLPERILYAFLVDHDRDVVVNAINGGMSAEQVFDLYTARPQSRLTTYAQEVYSEATLEKDMEVALLVVGDDGQPKWSVETLARKGETIMGSREMDNPDMSMVALVSHSQFGKVGVILKDGDYRRAPEPARAGTCPRARP